METQKRIFLSHAVKDKALADRLTELLSNGCAVNPNDILCTSLEGKGIPAGTSSFIESLRGQIQKPELVLLLLSENFFASHFCMCELGAVAIQELKRTGDSHRPLASHMRVAKAETTVVALSRFLEDGKHADFVRKLEAQYEFP